jgi:hypothetical protein
MLEDEEMQENNSKWNKSGREENSEYPSEFDQRYLAYL